MRKFLTLIAILISAQCFSQYRLSGYYKPTPLSARDIASSTSVGDTIFWPSGVYYVHNVHTLGILDSPYTISTLGMKRIGREVVPIKDTLPCLFLSVDTTHYYDQYYANGKIYKTDVLHPKVPKAGFYYVPRAYVHPNVVLIDGYEIYQQGEDFKMYVIGRLDRDKKPFVKPDIIVSLAMPKDGL